MSGGGTAQGALYSPLPQTISDTDSSEEELISVVQHNDSRKFVVSSKEPVEKRNGQKMGDYRTIDHANEQDIAINGFPNQQATADDVPIIKTEGTVPKHLRAMTALQLICFIFSILLCGLTIVVFLWVIPCDLATCPSARLKTGTRTWEKTFNQLEFKGTISVVPGAPGRGQNLIFLMRDDVTNPYLRLLPVHQEGADSLPVNGGGVISLIGYNGEPAWWKRFRSLPRDIDCSLVDLNNDNIDDCLVVGSGNLLIVFDSVSGNVIWLLHTHKNSTFDVWDIEFPLILPDLDDDNVNELVSTCRMVTNNGTVISDHNNLMLISGKTGQIIGQPFVINNCTSISSLQKETDYRVSFTCEQKLSGKGSSSSRREVQLQELYTKSTKERVSPFFNKMQNEHLPLKQHRSLEKPEALDGTWKTTDSLGRRVLTITRKCSDHNCTIYAKVTDGVPNNVVWNFTAENTDAMISVPLSLGNKSGRTNVAPSSVNGFVLKFWQANPEKRHMSQDDPSTHSLYRSHLKGGKRSVNFLDSADHNISRRSVPVGSNNISVFHYHENIVIVIFNGTKSKTFNTSQNSIVQICINSDTEFGHVLCQPNLGFQQQSMIIADLDRDGSQELISYLSTFKEDCKDRSNHHWRLETKVRVIRLDTELVKLYESTNNDEVALRKAYAANEILLESMLHA